jgi:hypothetical protein
MLQRCASSAIASCACRLLVELGGSTEVEDIDAVPFAENERLHLRIPALGLVSEVDSRFQQIFHGDRAQADYTPQSAGLKSGGYETINVC